MRSSVATTAGRSLPRGSVPRPPPTLFGALQARLDALPAAERRVAQLASVIGHLFWDGALAAIDPAAPVALALLVRRGFVVAQPTSTIAGNVEYAFQHHLLHQFTYRSVLRRDRRAADSRVADWLAQRAAEQLVARAEHHAEADERPAAVACLTDAAELAAARGTFELVVAHVTRALSLIDAADLIGRWRLLSVRETVIAELDDRAAHDADLDQLEGIADVLDDARRAEATRRRAAALHAAGRFIEGHAVAEAPVRLAERCADETLLTLSIGTLSASLWRLGEFAAASVQAERGLARARRSGLRAAELRLLRTLAAIYAESARLPAAMVAANRH